jgi:dipeptidyl aminopeptidase/acylaminoacyl peptidase
MLRRALAPTYIAFAVLGLSACGAPHASTSGGIAYVVGYSTDPYGNSKPKGFGVATGLIESRAEEDTSGTAEAPSGISWLGRDRVVVDFGNGLLKASPAAVFAFRDGRLERLGPPPLHPDENTFAWSPDRRLIATQPWLRLSCGAGARPGLVCTRVGRTIFIERNDGTARHALARGLLKGWTPSGQLLLFRGVNTEFSTGAFETLDVSSGRRRSVLSSRQVSDYAHRRAQLGELAYSTDGRYLAARVLFGTTNLRGIFVARANGHILRLITSKDIISMLAWSPRGHQLAYTTSGLPAPHELFVLSSPRARPRRILSQSPHFDWVTWSPDNRWLLIDNEHLHSWDLLRLTGHREAHRGAEGASVPLRRLPRLGGMPLWCCPQQSYGGA